MSQTQRYLVRTQSPLDQDPYLQYIAAAIEQGQTNASIVKNVRGVWNLDTTDDSIRRFRKRHGLQVPGVEKSYTRVHGDTADAATAPTTTPILDDPDTMLRQRGLDPEVWYIDAITVNEWDGPQAGGNKVTYYQAKFTAKRKRPELVLQPVRSDGWKPSHVRRAPVAGQPKLVVICGDAQAPFHDVKLHQLFCEWLEFNQPAEGIDLGDLMDFPDISRHPDDPDNVAVAQECLQAGYDILRDRVDASPSTKWKWMPGNHDWRLRDYLVKNAPRVAQIRRVDTHESDGEVVNRVDYLLRTDELGVEFIDPRGPYDLAQVNLSKNLAVRHGWIVRPRGGESAYKSLEKTGYSLLVGHCFDDQTEILTPDGWKTHDQLAVDSVVATYNRRLRLMEFQPAQEVHRYDHFKELIHIEGSCINLAVTDQHGLWTVPGATAEYGKWRETTAAEAFGTKQTFRLAAPVASEDAPVGDNWLQLAAWIMAEGHVGHVRRPWESVRIAQSDAPDGRLDRLEAILDSCGIAYSKVKRYDAGTSEHGTYRNYDAYRYGLLDVSQWTSEVERLMDTNKVPLPMLYSLSARQAAVFIDEYIWGDGHRGNPTQSAQLASACDDHIDLLQALASRAGWRSSVCVGKTVKYITISERNTVTVSAEAWSRQPYDGIAWCVSVPNGTLVVRRNGKVAVTLNTHRQAIVQHTTHEIDGKIRQLLAAETGCMCRLDSSALDRDDGGRMFPSYTPLADWQQGFASAYIYPDGKFKVDLASYVNGALLWNGQRYE